MNFNLLNVLFTAAPWMSPPPPVPMLGPVQVYFKEIGLLTPLTEDDAIQELITSHRYLRTKHLEWNKLEWNRNILRQPGWFTRFLLRCGF